MSLGRIGELAEARVVVSWLWYLQGLSNFFGSCFGYPFLWYLTVAPEPRAGVWDTLPEVFFETFVSQWLLSGLFYTRDSGGCARAHPPGVAPEALEE